MAQQTKQTIIGYNGCPELDVKWVNILDSFYHKDDGVIITNIVETATEVTFTFSDNSTLVIPLNGGGNTLTQEQVEDMINTLFQNGTHSNITVTYDDVVGSISLSGAASSSNLTQEQVEDFVGGVVVGGTGITATYNDAGDQLVISLSGVQFTSIMKAKIDNISVTAPVDLDTLISNVSFSNLNNDLKGVGTLLVAQTNIDVATYASWIITPLTAVKTINFVHVATDINKSIELYITGTAFVPAFTANGVAIDYGISTILIEDTKKYRLIFSINADGTTEISQTPLLA